MAGSGRQRKRERSRAQATAQASTARSAAKNVPAPDRVVLVLSLLGMLLTAYLTVVAWRGGDAAFCAAGSACDVVQGSRWSRLFGIPIAAWGFVLYALLAWTAWRPATPLARWRRLWRLSLVGLAISVYLTVAGLVWLQAACGWCLASLAMLAAIFALVHLRRPEAAPGGPWPAWWLGGGLMALALVAALHLLSTDTLQRPADARLVALAGHLEQAGVKYYGASWCVNCQRQSKLFGRAAAQLPYVECSPDGRNGGVAAECSRAGVGAYPTWMIGGQPIEGVIEPERLARLTGFDWDGAARQ